MERRMMMIIMMMMMMNSYLPQRYTQMRKVDLDASDKADGKTAICETDAYGPKRIGMGVYRSMRRRENGERKTKGGGRKERKRMCVCEREREGKGERKRESERREEEDRW